MQTAENVSQETIYEPSHVHFLEAWKDAVELMGPGLFTCHAPTVRAATHHHQLAPYLDKIRRAIPNKCRQDAVFLAALVSFFNAIEGDKMLRKAGCTFGDMVMVLNPPQRAALAQLMIHYRGW